MYSRGRQEDFSHVFNDEWTTNYIREDTDMTCVVSPYRSKLLPVRFRPPFSPSTETGRFAPTAEVFFHTI